MLSRLVASTSFVLTVWVTFCLDLDLLNSGNLSNGKTIATGMTNNAGKGNSELRSLVNLEIWTAGKTLFIHSPATSLTISAWGKKWVISPVKSTTSSVGNNICRIYHVMWPTCSAGKHWLFISLLELLIKLNKKQTKPKIMPIKKFKKSSKAGSAKKLKKPNRLLRKKLKILNNM